MPCNYTSSAIKNHSRADWAGTLPSDFSLSSTPAKHTKTRTPPESNPLNTNIEVSASSDLAIPSNGPTLRPSPCPRRRKVSWPTSSRSCSSPSQSRRAHQKAPDHAVPTMAPDLLYALYDFAVSTVAAVFVAYRQCTAPTIYCRAQRFALRFARTDNLLSRTALCTADILLLSYRQFVVLVDNLSSTTLCSRRHFVALVDILPSLTIFLAGTLCSRRQFVVIAHNNLPCKALRSRSALARHQFSSTICFLVVLPGQQKSARWRAACDKLSARTERCLCHT